MLAFFHRTQPFSNIADRIAILQPHAVALLKVTEMLVKGGHSSDRPTDFLRSVPQQFPALRLFLWAPWAQHEIGGVFWTNPSCVKVNLSWTRRSPYSTFFSRFGSLHDLGSPARCSNWPLLPYLHKALGVPWLAVIIDYGLGQIQSLLAFFAHHVTMVTVHGLQMGHIGILTCTVGLFPICCLAIFSFPAAVNKNSPHSNHSPDGCPATANSTTWWMIWELHNLGQAASHVSNIPLSWYTWYLYCILLIPQGWVGKWIYE